MFAVHYVCPLMHEVAWEINKRYNKLYQAWNDIQWLTIYNLYRWIAYLWGTSLDGQIFLPQVYVNFWSQLYTYLSSKVRLKYSIQVYSKKTLVNVTLKSVHWSHTQFRVKSDPEFGQRVADLTNNEVDLNSGLYSAWSFSEVADFRVIIDPEFSVTPMDPFKFDPGVFTVVETEEWKDMIFLLVCLFVCLLVCFCLFVCLFVCFLHPTYFASRLGPP